MHEECVVCGRSYDRGPGYWLGSIYFNYGITGMIMLAAYFGFYFSEVLTSGQSLVVLSVFCLLFPLWFFRYSRALWIAFDECLDPWPETNDREKPS